MPSSDAPDYDYGFTVPSSGAVTPIIDYGSNVLARVKQKVNDKIAECVQSAKTSLDAARACVNDAINNVIDDSQSLFNQLASSSSSFLANFIASAWEYAKSLGIYPDDYTGETAHGTSQGESTAYQPSQEATPTEVSGTPIAISRPGFPGVVPQASPYPQVMRPGLPSPVIPLRPLGATPGGQAPPTLISRPQTPQGPQTPIAPGTRPTQPPARPPAPSQPPLQPPVQPPPPSGEPSFARPPEAGPEPAPSGSPGSIGDVTNNMIQEFFNVASYVTNNYAGDSTLTELVQRLSDQISVVVGQAEQIQSTMDSGRGSVVPQGNVTPPTTTVNVALSDESKTYDKYFDIVRGTLNESRERLIQFFGEDFRDLYQASNIDDMVSETNRLAFGTDEDTSKPMVPTKAGRDYAV